MLKILNDEAKKINKQMKKNKKALGAIRSKSVEAEESSSDKEDDEEQEKN